MLPFQFESSSLYNAWYKFCMDDQINDSLYFLSVSSCSTAFYIGIHIHTNKLVFVLYYQQHSTNGTNDLPNNSLIILTFLFIHEIISPCTLLPKEMSYLRIAGEKTINAIHSHFLNSFQIIFLQFISSFFLQ